MITPKKTIILGIDPGYGRVGYGFIECVRGNVVCKTYGCISTKASQSMPERLCAISAELKRLVSECAPHIVAIEKLFFAKNVTTALDVSQARGAIILTLAQLLSAPIIELTPLQVKQATTGYGGATKAQMQKMVQQLLKLDTLPRPDDAADALALAITASSYRPMTHSA